MLEIVRQLNPIQEVHNIKAHNLQERDFFYCPEKLKISIKSRNHLKPNQGRHDTIFLFMQLLPEMMY